MTREEALKHIEEAQKVYNEFGGKHNILEFYQDLSEAYGLPLEDVTERMMVTGGGVGFARPIREQESDNEKQGD